MALAFRYEGAAGAEEWDDLVVRPLLTDRLVALVPEGHRLARSEGVGSVAIGELARESWIAGCPRCRGQLVEVCEGAGFTPRIDFATDDTRRWSAWSARASAWPCCPSSPSIRTAAGRAYGHAGAGVRREIVALTLPDLAQVPAVTATLDELARAGARQSATR